MTTSEPLDLTMARMNKVMDEIEKLLTTLGSGRTHQSSRVPEWQSASVQGAGVRTLVLWYLALWSFGTLSLALWTFDY